MTAIAQPSLWLPPRLRKPRVPGILHRARSWLKRFTAPIGVASSGDLLLSPDGLEVIGSDGNIVLDDGTVCPTCCSPCPCACFTDTSVFNITFSGLLLSDCTYCAGSYNELTPHFGTRDFDSNLSISIQRRPSHAGNVVGCDSECDFGGCGIMLSACETGSLTTYETFSKNTVDCDFTVGERTNSNLGVTLHQFCNGVYILLAYILIFEDIGGGIYQLADFPIVVFNESFTWDCPTHLTKTVNNTGGSNILDCAGGPITGICTPFGRQSPLTPSQSTWDAGWASLYSTGVYTGSGNSISHAGSATITRTAA